MGRDFFALVEAGQEGLLVIAGEGGIHLQNQGVNTVPNHFYGHIDSLHIQFNRVIAPLCVAGNLDILVRSSLARG